MMFRVLATGLTLTGLVALGAGPVRVALDRNPAEVGTDAVRPLALAQPDGWSGWEPGLVDTRRLREGRPVARIAKPERIDLAQAMADLQDPDTLSVVGAPSEESLPGVGVVVTSSDARALLEIPEPRRSRVVSQVVAPDGLALSVFAVETPPRRALVVDLDSGPGRREKLAEASPDVAALVTGWAQVRPDLRALVSRGGREATAHRAPVEQEWRDAVGAVVRSELLPALDAARAPMADRLLGGLLSMDDGATAATAQGAAYAVAGRAVVPGSRLLPVRGADGLDARVVQRPDGRVAVLVWNPGGDRTLTVQVPDAGRALRYELRLAGGTFSAALLPR